MVRTFDELQEGLGPVLAVHREGGQAEHVVVVLPSLSFGRSVEVYYGARLPALEHRFLLMLTMLRRLPGCSVIFVMSVAPTRRCGTTTWTWPGLVIARTWPGGRTW